MSRAAGLAGYLTSVSLDWPLISAVTVAALARSFTGARLAGRIPEVALGKGFGIFVLVMGVFVLVQELPAPGGLIVGIVAGAALAAAVCWFVVPACPLRKAPAPVPAADDALVKKRGSLTAVQCGGLALS